MTAFTEHVTDRITRYVMLRRALGYVFAKQATILGEFGRFVEQRREAGPLTQDVVLAYVLGCGVTPNERQRRYRVVKNFADYFAIFDRRTPSLDPYVLPRSRAIPPVRILDDGELRRLLDAAKTISPHFPMRGQTLHTIIGLLASTGLRSGEVVRLDRDDVDLTHGILRIRRTKFRKDRLVPVHSTTRAVLRRYATARDRAYPKATSPGFFLSLRGGRLSGPGFHGTFRAVRAKARLDVGLPRGVRPHDLRHRFAVTRLVMWHRQRVDVQARLPLLATSQCPNTCSAVRTPKTRSPSRVSRARRSPSGSRTVSARRGCAHDETRLRVCDRVNLRRRAALTRTSARERFYAAGR